MNTQDELVRRVLDNLEVVRGRIRTAASRAGRDPSGIRLLAVSKAHPVDVVIAGVTAGHRLFGENYAQELAAKYDHFTDGGRPEFHFIGGLQRNKVKLVVGRAALIHSVDSESLLREINRRAAQRGLVQPILLEVNVGREASKSGCEPGELDDLLRAALESEHISCRGLMTVPPFDLDAEEVRPHFKALRSLRDELAAQMSAPEAAAFQELSMGMSHDLEVAVEEGATLVRVGSAIFGPRPVRT